MKLVLVRAFQDWSVTLGMLQIENVRHDPVFTLENPLRSTPVDSLIPAGTYRLKPYSSPRWPNVYEVTGVPGRTSILMHHGNFESDTEGCILVGLAAGILRDQAAVMQSKQGMEFLRKMIGTQECDLQIIDGWSDKYALTFHR